MTDKTFVAGPIQHNLQHIREHICPGCVRKAQEAAALDMATYELPNIGGDQEADLTALSRAIEFGIKASVLRFAKDHGLGAKDMTGVMLQCLNNAQVALVDELYSERHPLLRLVYLGTLQRALLANSAVATVMEAVDSGYITGPDDDISKRSLSCFLGASDNPLPLDVVNTLITQGHTDDAQPDPEADMPAPEPTVMQVANLLLSLMPEGPEKERLTKRLADAQGKPETVVGDKPATKVTLEAKSSDGNAGIIAIEGEPTDEEIADAICAQLPPGVDRAAILEGVKQAQVNGGAVVKVSKPQA